MAHVIDSRGVDLGDITNPDLLTYYRREPGYTVGGVTTPAIPARSTADVLPVWAANTIYVAGQEILDPTGVTILVRQSTGTSRATYDTTEQALWSAAGAGGGGGGGSAVTLTPTAVKTANYTAAASDFVPVDTTSGNVTVTFPTAPADKAQVEVKHVIRGGTNAVTLAAGGTDKFNVAGGSATASLSLLREAATFQYAASSGLWYALNNDLPLSQLDLRYVQAGTGGLGLGWYDVTSSTYGATLARAVYDAVTTSGSATVTSATAAFVAGDVGKKVLLADTAAHAFVGTISTVNSATSITMTATCTFTGTSVALAIGADCTTAIQNAVNDAAAAGGGTIYFPGAGKNAIYLILGAQQSGSVTGTGVSAGNTFTYTGQILFPANLFANPMAPIRLMGGTPAAQATLRPVLGGPPDPGVVLLSSATSGAVFDAVPVPAAPGAWVASTATTNLHGFFEDMVIRTCPGQAVIAVGARKFVGLNLRSVVVDIFASAGWASSTASASSIGIDSPATGNEGSLRYRDVEVNVYGTGMTMTEHTNADGVYIQACKVAVLMMGGGHLNKIEKGCIQHTDTLIKSNSATPSRLIGDITFEGSGAASFLVIDDINGAIHGTLTVMKGDPGPTSGLPVNGGWGVNFKVISGAVPDYALLGSVGQPVQEDFTRINASSTSLQATGISNHIYETGVSNAAVGVVSSKGVPTAAGYGTSVVRCPFQSVVVRSRITLSSTQACIGITPRDKQVGQLTCSVMLEKNASNDRIAITKWDGSTLTTLATLESAGLVLGSTYELSVKWDQPIKNGPAVITVYLGGVQQLTYTLTSGDQVTFGSPACVGLAHNLHSFHDDGGSRWLDFYAFPI